MRQRTDVVVVGAGAAGLATAFVAAAHGARVLLAERGDATDSNFAISGGLIAAAGTAAQRDAGVEDSPRLWAQDIAEASAGTLPAEHIRLVDENAVHGLAALEVATGESFRLVESVHFPGHSVARLHELGGRAGPALAALLVARAAEHPRITLATACAVLGLLRDDGGVRGVRVLRDGAQHEVDAAAVVLAGGGFGANPEMVRRFMPEMADAFYIGSPTNTGDTMRWAEALGATLQVMTGYQGHGHATLDGKGRLGAGVTSVGALLVDTNGRRFVREDIGPSGLAGHVAARPKSLAVEIYSEPMHEQFLRFASYRQALERGAPRRFDDLAALSVAFGIDGAALTKTIAQFNACARGEASDALGRSHFAGEVTAPFWAVGVTAALAHTQGGLRVDGDGRVQRDGGAPIAGLFAAGGCVLGLSGSSPAGYLPGHGLGQAVALAFLAGRGAAARRAVQ